MTNLPINSIKLIFLRFWWLILIIFIAGGSIFFLIKNNKQKDVVPIKTSSSQTSIAEISIINCPTSLTYQDDNTSPMADYGDSQKQITEEEATNIRNNCSNVVVKATSTASNNISPSNSSSSKDSSVQTTDNSSSSDQNTNSDTNNNSENSDSKSDNNSTIIYGSVITPYFSESDITAVMEAYSLNANNPYWGFFHPGVDFMTEHDIQVRASVGGTIENLVTEKSDGIMGWHTGFCINPGGQNSVCYNLETFSHEQAIGDKQITSFKVKTGDKVNQGDYIGDLVYGGSGAHIDFGITAPGTRICPEPYFTTEAKESVMRLIQKLQPTWPMCAD